MQNLTDPFTRALGATLRCLDRPIQKKLSLNDSGYPNRSSSVSSSRSKKALMSVLNPAVPTISEDLLNTSGIAIINWHLSATYNSPPPRGYAYTSANTTESGSTSR